MKKRSRVEKKLRRRKMFFRFVLLIFIFSLLIMLAFKTTFFNINNIKVIGNKKMTYDNLVNASLIKSGENIFKVSTRTGEKALKNLPYIKEAKIRRKLPKTIIIEVDERKEIALIKNISTFLYIDIDGYVLQAKNNNEDKLPIIVGLNIDNLKPSDNIYSQIENKEIIDLITVSNSLKILPEIETIDMTDNNNINITLNNGISVAFGGIDNVKYKLSFLSKILKDIEEKEISCKMILMNKGENPIIITDN
ncbi:FtsQ-type POTRA domain-containing protein [Tissierella sp. MSJ-40]|uniref:FtsQ-type POTRA domain-containing protein n=1 Tax=Tissierella simiarum TaxID=2841534 RepID=A0ABS6E7G9_9FIRM|nr:FtsQ-type POTRA domain-containing protein [Tissierella simiarum]MBU5438173.1 FtsQ-type POTRA domain-containing protein [Tissierella simiarum]